MKVIILQPHQKLGNIGEIIKVAPGYAKNFLMPNKIVDYASHKNIRKITKNLTNIQQEYQKKQEEIQKNFAKIHHKFFLLKQQASENNKLYGSVKIKNIAKIISQESGLNVDKKFLSCNYKIKDIGIHKIQINPLNNISFTIFLNIARNDVEAQNNQKIFVESNPNPNINPNANTNTSASTNLSANTSANNQQSQ